MAFGSCLECSHLFPVMQLDGPCPHCQRKQLRIQKVFEFLEPLLTSAAATALCSVDAAGCPSKASQKIGVRPMRRREKFHCRHLTGTELQDLQSLQGGCGSSPAQVGHRSSSSERRGLPTAGRGLLDDSAAIKGRGVEAGCGCPACGVVPSQLLRRHTLHKIILAVPRLQKHNARAVSKKPTAQRATAPPLRPSFMAVSRSSKA